ncbi:DUF5011 domain-containing protein [Candidatus Parcubacteria bacterium]|nr:DUF5011 domain-containing protein [Candidatus Parcubacteria bacterium]
MAHQLHAAATNSFAIGSSTQGSPGQVLLVDQFGNFGLGTTAPSARLSLVGQSLAVVPLLTFSTSSANATATAFNIDSNGKVGIGTSSSQYQLAVQGGLFVAGSGLATSTVIGGVIDVQGSATNTFSGGIKANQLSVANGLTITGGTIGSLGTGTSTFAGTINVTNAGTSTWNGGHNITAGCFSINNTCLSTGGSATPGGSDGFVQFNSGGTSFGGTSDFVWRNNGSHFLGIGTSTPQARLSVANAAGVTTPTFLVSTTTSGNATSTAFIIDSNGKVGIGTTSPGNALSVNGSFFVASGATPGLIVDPSGNVGIGVTDPDVYKLLVNGTTRINGTFYANGQITGANQISIQDSANAGTVINNTGTGFVSLAAGGGKVGVGATTSPWAYLSVVGNSNAGTPAFVIATTTTGTGSGGQYPLFFVTSTTTGALDFARVAIGTTTTFSATSSVPDAGLRDQFTVAGRIYSTWRYASCDILGGQLLGKTFASTANLCGPFAFFEDGDGVIRTASSTPTYFRIEGSSRGSIGTGEGAYIRTLNEIGTKANNMVMEAWVRTGLTGGTAAVAPTTLVGFIGTTTNFDMTAQPADGIYFVSSTTHNGGTWKVVAKTTGGTATDQSTGVAIASSSNPNNVAFQKLRLEITPNDATFLINGQVVARLTTGLPTNALAPIVSTNQTGTAPTGISILDVSLLRVWMDDPPGGGTPEVPGLTVVPENSEEENKDMDLGYAGNDGLWYRSASSTPPSGSIVGLDLAEESLPGTINSTVSPYSDNIIGVVSDNPRAVYGPEVGDIPVASTGNVNVLVSLANGPISKGSRITSSGQTGIGMKATHAGYIIGRALTDFDPVNGKGVCQNQDIATTTDKGANCVGIITISMERGYDGGSGYAFRDIGTKITDAGTAALELADDTFKGGLDMMQLVVGKVVAKVVIVKDFFASVITVLPQGDIKVPAGENQIVGDSIFPAGATQILVQNSKVTANSKIFITPKKSVASPLAVTELRSGVGFVVSASTAMTEDVPFDWILITSYDSGGKSGTQILNTGSSGSGNNSTSTTTTTTDENTNHTTSADTEAPVIVVSGNNPAHIFVGDNYADLGASVTDNVDHNLGIHTEGADIDTSKAGTYTVIYTATDQAGNTGEARRTVNVTEHTIIETPPPPPEPTTTPITVESSTESTTTPTI